MCVYSGEKERNMGTLHLLTFEHGKKIILFCHFYFTSHSASMISLEVFVLVIAGIAGAFRFILVLLVILFG